MDELLKRMDQIDQRLGRMERSLAALAERKPEKPKTDGPFFKRKEAIELLKTRNLLDRCEKAGWLKAIRRGRLVFFLRTEVMECVYRVSQGELPY